MFFKEAFSIFTKELRRDKSLYQSYKANIAMAYYDCARWEGSRDSLKKIHTIGNRAADHFLKLLLESTTKKGGKGSKEPDVVICLNGAEYDCSGNSVDGKGHAICIRKGKCPDKLTIAGRKIAKSAVPQRKPDKSPLMKGKSKKNQIIICSKGIEYTCPQKQRK